MTQNIWKILHQFPHSHDTCNISASYMRAWLTVAKKAATAVFSLPTFPHSLPSRTRTNCSSDERRRVSDVVQAFSLDEIRHIRWEVLVVGLDVVLQDQATQRTGRFICKNGEIPTPWYTRLELQREKKHRTKTHTYLQIWGWWGQRSDSCWSLETGWAAPVSLGMIVKDSNTLTLGRFITIGCLVCVTTSYRWQPTTTRSESPPHTPVITHKAGTRTLEDTSCTALCVAVSGDCESLRSWSTCCKPCSSGCHSILKAQTFREHN